MFIFQTIAFFISMLFWLCFAGMFAFYFNKLFINSTNAKKRSKYITNLYDIKTYSNEKPKKSIEYIFIRIIGILISLPIFVCICVPYILDTPKLIAGDFNYVSGYVSSIRTKHRDINEYVYIDRIEVKFFFSSNMEENDKYKIAYLPHTSKAIYGEKLNTDLIESEAKINFSLKQILSFICILICAIVLLFISPYIGFKLLILSSIIYYPTNIYLYISEGLTYSNWLSLSNEPLFYILFGLIILVFIFLMYFIEKYKNDDAFFSLFLIQVISILMILILLSEELHLF